MGDDACIPKKCLDLGYQAKCIFTATGDRREQYSETELRLLDEIVPADQRRWSPPSELSCATFMLRHYIYQFSTLAAATLLLTRVAGVALPPRPHERRVEASEESCRSRGCINHALVRDGETQIVDLTRARDNHLRYFDVVHPCAHFLRLELANG